MKNTLWPSTTVCALVLSVALLMPASTPAAHTILHNFTSGANDGYEPVGSLTLSGSTLYGTTYGGGSDSLGTIFRINTDGTGFSLIHSFTGIPSDGSTPRGSLTLSGSKLYGTTQFGGSSANWGTIFSINTDGTGFSVIHNFQSIDSTSVHPGGTLTLSGSKLYGATSVPGGSNGTVFSMNTDGSGFVTLRSFSNTIQSGSGPGESLTISGSTLYGMTYSGGGGARGTIFRMNTDGTGFSLLHNFAGSDGQNPTGSLTLSGSKLYGMTTFGGSGSKGTIFSMNTDGTGFSLLHSFSGTPGDGKNPNGSLTLSGSKLYGMTSGGGTGDRGTIFSINTDGTGYVLESFLGSPTDGSGPHGNVTLSGDGTTLYGMTAVGGTANTGVIFSSAIVPEPGSAALLGVGALLLAARRRRAEA